MRKKERKEENEHRVCNVHIRRDIGFVKKDEKLREKKFDEFQKEERDNESKEIDQLVSFTYNN